MLEKREARKGIRDGNTGVEKDIHDIRKMDISWRISRRIYEKHHRAAAVKNSGRGKGR